jgi:peptide/nickel transport system substrate-binding protein
MRRAPGEARPLAGRISMRREIRQLGASLSGLVLAGGVLGACGGGSPVAAQGPSAHYVLTVATTAGPLSRNFNPFLPTSVSLTDNVASFIYEPLVQVNPFKPLDPTPWLATSWAWSDNDHTLTMQLRHGVRWSDGSPFTAADVAFTFNLLKTHPADNTTGVSFQSVKATGPYTVVFTFAEPGYSQFYNLSSQVYIVPQKIWSKVNPVTYADPDPVGTGPYTLTSFSTQGFILTRNTHYWQKGKPVVYQLRFPSYDGNGPANIAVEDGTAQWAGQFIPDIGKVYLSKSKYNHDWSPATSQVALVPNVSRYPLNQLVVRQAISEALNRQYVAKESESGQASAQTNATGVLPNESEFIAPQYKNATFTYNPGGAKKLLESAGWQPGPGGVLAKGGRPLNLTLTENSGFSDYMTGAQVISQELNAVGFHVTVSGVSNNAWTADLTDGNFQLTTDYSNVEGIDPEVIYQGWLDDSLIHGNNAGADFGRWRDPRTEADFHQYLTATTTAARQAAITGLEGIMVKQLPVFVLYGGPDWTQYNDQTLVGWPTPADPYDPGAPFIPNNEVVVLHLHFRGK